VYGSTRSGPGLSVSPVARRGRLMRGGSRDTQSEEGQEAGHAGHLVRHRQYLHGQWTSCEYPDSPPPPTRLLRAPLPSTHPPWEGHIVPDPGSRRSAAGQDKRSPGSGPIRRNHAHKREPRHTGNRCCRPQVLHRCISSRQHRCNPEDTIRHVTSVASARLCEGGFGPSTCPPRRATMEVTRNGVATMTYLGIDSAEPRIQSGLGDTLGPADLPHRGLAVPGCLRTAVDDRAGQAGRQSH
jgi:hypothetical protein